MWLYIILNAKNGRSSGCFLKKVWHQEKNSLSASHFSCVLPRIRSVIILLKIIKFVSGQ
jgi:hypothetical protein